MYNCLMRLKILIIDYDQFQADLLEKVIKELGHDVFTTVNVEKALKLVQSQCQQNNPFDLVFTEFMLGQVTGIDLCKQLKAIDPVLTVIMVTADNSQETKKLVAEYGGLAGFISKSSDVAEIGYQLDIAMSNKKARLSGEKSEYLKRMKDNQK